MLAFRESCVTELEQLSLQSQELLASCAEHEVNQRWSTLEEVRRQRDLLLWTHGERRNRQTGKLTDVKIGMRVSERKGMKPVMKKEKKTING